MKNLVKVLSIATLLSGSVFADGCGPSNMKFKDIALSAIKNQQELNIEKSEATFIDFSENVLLDGKKRLQWTNVKIGEKEYNVELLTRELE